MPAARAGAAPRQRRARREPPPRKPRRRSDLVSRILVAIPLAVAELPRAIDRLALVSEAQLARAVAEFAEHGIRVEGAAAASLAALRAEPDLPRPVVLVVTGRNIDDELYARVLRDA